MCVNQEQQEVVFELQTQAAVHPGLAPTDDERDESRPRILVTIGAIDQYCKQLVEVVGPFTNPVGGQPQVVETPLGARPTPQSALERVQAALRASSQWRQRAESEHTEHEEGVGPKEQALVNAMRGVRKALHMSRPKPTVVV